MPKATQITQNSIPRTDLCGPSVGVLAGIGSFSLGPFSLGPFVLIRPVTRITTIIGPAIGGPVIRGQVHRA